MRAALFQALAVAALSSTGCSLVVGSMNQCSSDDDCLALGAGLGCKEQMCVSDDLVARCETIIGDTTSANPLVLGAIFPFTSDNGSVDPRGQARTNALQLAVDEINSRNGVQGQLLRVVVCDDSGDDTEAADLALNYLIPRKQVPAIITPGSQETIKIASVTVPAGVLIISGSATSPDITYLDKKQHPDDSTILVWRLAPSDTIQGTVIASLLAGQKVALLAVDDAYGQGLANVFSPAFKVAGNADPVKYYFDVGASKAQVDKANTDATSKPVTSVFVIGYPADVTTILETAADGKHGALASAKWFFSDAADSSSTFDSLPAGAKAMVDGARGTLPVEPTTNNYDDFMARYNSRFPDSASTSYIAQNYDAMYLLAIAANWAATTGDQTITGETMAQGLSRLSDPTGIHFAIGPTTYGQVVAALAQKGSLNLDGTSGPVDMDPATGDVSSPIEVWQYTQASSITARPTVQLGALLSLTGDLATAGQDQLLAARLAAEQVTAAGGVLGSDLVLISGDDATSADQGTATVRLLLDAKTPAVIGATSSAVTLAAAAITAPAQVPMLSPSATSPALTTFTPSGYLFRTCPSDTLQGTVLAEQAISAGYTTIAVAYIPDVYGQGLSSSFVSAFTQRGGTITKSIPYVEGQGSYAEMLASLLPLASPPKAMLLVAYPTDGAQIVRDWLSGSKAGTLPSVYWYFTDALYDPSFVNAVGKGNFTFSHEGTSPSRGITTPPGSSPYDVFAGQFLARYGRQPNPGTQAANAYDAVKVVALSIIAAGKADGASIAANLVQASQSYAGVSGPVHFDSHGDVVGGYDIWQVGSDGTTTITASDVMPQ